MELYPVSAGVYCLFTDGEVHAEKWLAERYQSARLLRLAVLEFEKRGDHYLCTIEIGLEVRALYRVPAIVPYKRYHLGG